jgi:hypothetical protein
MPQRGRSSTPSKQDLTAAHGRSRFTSGTDDASPNFECAARSFTGSIEESIAIDIFASFMLSLAKKDGGAPLTRFMTTAAGHGCDRLSDILVDKKVCTSKHAAKIAIVPALVACGIPLPATPPP